MPFRWLSRGTSSAAATRGAQPEATVPTTTTSNTGTTPWTPTEHSKCVEMMDKTMHQLRRLHSQTAQTHQQSLSTGESPSVAKGGGAPGVGGVGDGGGGDAAARDMREQQEQEQREAHLIATALNSKDVVGLFSLLTAFWTTRNELRREVRQLERRVATCQIYDHDHNSNDAGEEASSQEQRFLGPNRHQYHPTAAATAADSPVDQVIRNAKQLLDELISHAVVEDEAQQERFAARGVFLAKDGLQRPMAGSVRERMAAAAHHSDVIEKGSYADLVFLSLELQQEYQRLHKQLYDPFTTSEAVVPTTASAPRATNAAAFNVSNVSDVRFSSSSTPLQQQHRQHHHAAALLPPPHETNTTSDEAYLSSVHELVATALSQHEILREDVHRAVVDFSSHATEFFAPPMVRFLGGVGGGAGGVSSLGHEVGGGINNTNRPSSGSSSTVEAAVHLLPQPPLTGEDGDLLAPLGAATTTGRVAGSSSSSALWRMVKFVAVEGKKGQSLRSVLASVLRHGGVAPSDDHDDDDTRREGTSSLEHAEQWNVQNIFSVDTKRCVAESPDLWLPQDPRLQDEGGRTAPASKHTRVAVHGGGGGGALVHRSHTRSTTFSPPLTLDCVLKRDTWLAVRVVVPLRGLAASINVLAHQRRNLESTALPEVRRQLEALKKALWDAEIAAIQHRTTATGASEDTVRNIKRDILDAEARRAHLEQSLSQTTHHLRALDSGNVATLSALLTAATNELLLQQQWSSLRTDGDDGDDGGGTANSYRRAAERVIYVCKELPAGMTLDGFAKTHDVPVEELHVFDDLSLPHPGTTASTDGGVIGSSPSFSSSSPPRRAKKRTMVYLPMRVPVQSTFEQDEVLQAELDAFARRYPSFPPNAEILEQLRALRSGDLNTLSSLLSAARKRREQGEALSETGVLRQQLASLQQELLCSLREHEATRRQVESLEQRERALQVELEKQGWNVAKRDDRGSGPKTSFPTQESVVQPFIDRGVTPADAVMEMSLLLRQRDAEILSLQESLRLQQAAADGSTSSSRAKQRVAQLEEVLSTARKELSDEVARGAELSARILQLEALHQAASSEKVSQTKKAEELQSLVTALQRQIQDLETRLREARAVAHTADVQRAVAQRNQTALRLSFAAKEIPAGMTASEYLDLLGVDAVTAELCLAKGTVYDPVRNQHIMYVPMQLDRAAWGHEDLRLQEEVKKMAALLATAHAAPSSGSLLTNGAGDGASTEAIMRAHTDLLEQLAALRAGDTVALSVMLRSAREALGSRGLGDAARRASAAPPSDSGASCDSGLREDALREDEDLAWTTVREGRMKVTFLRRALQQADRERLEWKALCEEYQSVTDNDAETSQTLDHVRQAKLAAEKRCEATVALLQNKEQELATTTAALQQAKAQCAQLQQSLVELRAKHAAEVDSVMTKLQGVVDVERSNFQQERQQLKRQLEESERLREALQQALDEMGVEVEVT